MTVSTSAAFLDLLRESHVLSSEAFQRAENLIGDAADTKAAARKLVKAELLTKWQAGQLLLGSPLLSLGKYVLLDRLAWGSTHAVFLATHPMMERKVALNVLDRKRSGRSDSVSGFLSDARSIASLDHRNLIHVFDVDEAEQRYFLVMEYVDGRNLHEVVKTDGPLAVDAAADIIRQIAEGLQSAHKNKLVHGGLRPTNAILDRQGTVKIIDLGLAKFDDPTKQPEGKAEDSKILSIADYLSPEQAMGQMPTPASDIYSLGCIGFWLLTGESPFGQGSYTQRLQRHQHDSVPDVRSLRKNVPEPLAKIVEKMMAKSPGDRHAEAKDVSDELHAWWNEYSSQLEASKPKPKPVPAKPASSSGAHPAARNGAKPPPARSSQPAKASASQSSGNPSPIVIDTGRKATPKPSPQPKGSTAKAPPAAETPTTSPVAPPGPPAKDTDDAKPPADAPSPAGSKMPLLLIIGGICGALLLAAAASGVTAFFLMDREKPQEVAVATDDTKTSADAVNTSDPGDGTTTPPANEVVDDNSPDKPVDEPDLPAPGDEEQGGDDDPPPDAPADGGDPAVDDPPPDGGDPAPPADPPKEDPPKDKPPKVKPPKDPPKEPPKKANPFEGVAPAVALPALPGGEQPSEAILAKPNIPADTTIYVDLLGGDKVTPDEKDRFTLAPARRGLADREWELKLEGPADGPAVIATMELTDAGLSFKWTEEAAKLEAAPYVSNCQLNLRTSDHEAFVSLRQPQQATALAYRLDRPVLRERFSIAHPPRADSIFVEFTGVGGYEKFGMQPKDRLTVDRDTTGVQFGEGENQTVGAKIDTAMQKELQITMTAYIKGGDEWVPFNQRKLQAAGAQLANILQQIPKAQEQAKKIQNEKLKKQTIQQIETQKNAAEAQYAELEKLGKQLESIATEKNVYVKFRVFYDTGNETVTLIDGQTAPEPPQAPPGGAKKD